MTRSFANGNGASVANGALCSYPDHGWDIRPVTFWDLIGQGRDYR